MDRILRLRLDIERSAQGPAAWLDSNNRGEKTRFPSENR
jgi:hypothetical protein